MTVAYDAFSSTSNNSGTSTSWTHTPVGTPKGIIVYVRSPDIGGTDTVTGATYGGVTMTEVSGSPNLGASGDDPQVYAYFLGSGIPTGSQTVAVTHTNPGLAYTLFFDAISLTAAADTQVQDSDGTINSASQANPSVTLSLGGLNSFCCIGFGSGQGVVGSITPLTGWTSRIETDHGAKTSGIYTYDTVSTADVTAGWTQTADDASAIAIAVTEVGGTNKTLTAGAGSYTLTGTAAGVLVKRVVVASAGSYAFTGTAATLIHGYPIAAGAGSYSLSGTAVGLLHGWILSAGVGAYAFTGTDAALSKGLTLPAGVGSYTLTGTAALLLWTKALSAGAGSYVFSGSAAGVLHGWNLAAGVGAYALTGSAASLLASKVAVAGEGSYVFSGSAVSLTHAWRIPADSGAYSFTGMDAGLSIVAARTLAAGTGSYLISGSAAALLWARFVSAEAGAYAFNGTSATLTIGAAAAGSHWRHIGVGIML